MKKEKVAKKSEGMEVLIAQGPIVPVTTTSEDEDEEMEGEEEQEEEEEVQVPESEGEPADPSPQKPSPRMEQPKTKGSGKQTTLTQIQGGVAHEPMLAADLEMMRMLAAAPSPSGRASLSRASSSTGSIPCPTRKIAPQSTRRWPGLPRPSRPSSHIEEALGVEDSD